MTSVIKNSYIDRGVEVREISFYVYDWTDQPTDEH